MEQFVSIKKLSEAAELHEARRVRKYVLIYCSAGAATIAVDENVFELTAETVITITSGQIHRLLKTENADGFVLEFTYDFFCRNDGDIELVFHNSLFCHFAMNEITRLGEKNSIALQLAQIEKELIERPYQFLISVHSRIELILVEINRAKIASGGEIYKPDALFLKFLEAVRADFAKKPSVRQIAAALATTEAKLNELSKLHTGRTAQSVIYNLTASEAKRLLAHEKLSVKETAFQLGFEDPFYFSNFFKKQTNLSPKSYKEKFS